MKANLRQLVRANGPLFPKGGTRSSGFARTETEPQRLGPRGGPDAPGEAASRAGTMRSRRWARPGRAPSVRGGGDQPGGPACSAVRASRTRRSGDPEVQARRRRAWPPRGPGPPPTPLPGARTRGGAWRRCPPPFLNPNGTRSRRDPGARGPGADRAPQGGLGERPEPEAPRAGRATPDGKTHRDPAPDRRRRTALTCTWGVHRRRPY